MRDGKADFNIASLRQVLDDYETDRLSSVIVGREEGFMDHLREPLQELKKEYGEKVQVSSVMGAINTFCDTVQTLVE